MNINANENEKIWLKPFLPILLCRVPHYIVENGITYPFILSATPHRSMVVIHGRRGNTMIVINGRRGNSMIVIHERCESMVMIHAMELV